MPSGATTLESTDFDRILIIKPSSLGDIIHALPVLNGLRIRYPDAHIDWLVNDSFADVLDGHPQLTNVVRFNRSAFARSNTSTSAFRGLMAIIRSLRRARYDLVVDLQGLFRSGFFARVTGAPIRLGFSDAREGAVHFYSHRLNVPDHDIHAVEKNYLAANTLGFGDAPIHFDLNISDDDRRGAQSQLENHDISMRDPFVAICPGARWETKLWYADRFAMLADQIQQSLSLPVVLVGAPDECELHASIRKCADSRPVSLAGETSIREMLAVIESASGVVTLDSAPMHIAAALYRPLVSIIGPTSPVRTGPYGCPNSILSSQVDCSPCYLKRMSQCAYHHECMTSITVDAVVEQLKRQL